MTGRHRQENGVIGDAIGVLAGLGVSRDAARAAVAELARERGVTLSQSASLVVALVDGPRRPAPSADCGAGHTSV